MKKVYFAGSIRAGREDAGLYYDITNLINTKHKVLTEHIGCKDLASMGEQGMSDEEIYERDCKWIRECDVLLAEVTQVSLGVGYEIAYAESLGKQIVCLYRESEGKRLSAMINGNQHLKVIVYSSYDEIKTLFENGDLI